MENFEDVIKVECTDNGNIADGVILNWHGDTVKVNLNGIVLNFKKLKGSLYVANAVGMEFIIDMKGK